MLGYAELVVRNARPITPLLWCKARSQNIGFYEKHGGKSASKKIQEKDAQKRAMLEKFHLPEPLLRFQKRRIRPERASGLFRTDDVSAADFLYHDKSKRITSASLVCGKSS